MAEEQKAFRKWLTDNYPVASRPFHVGNFKTHPFYNYWKTNIAPKPARISAPFGFPQVSTTEYLKKTDVLISQMVEAKTLSEKVAVEMGLDVYNRVTLEGVNPNLPLFNEVMTPIIGGFTKRKQQEALQQWRQQAIVPGQLISPQSLESLGAFEGLSPEAESQARLEAQNRFNMGVWQAGQTQQAGAQRWQAQLGGLATQRQLNLQAQERRQFSERDTMRQQLLAEADALISEDLNAPRDWIQRHLAEQEAARLRWSARSLRPGVRGEERAGLERQAAWQGVRERAFERGGLGQYTIPEEAPVGFQGGRRRGGGGPPPIRPPTTPGFLTQFVPGLTAGEEIQKLPVTPGSAQLWGRTPFAQQQKLAGFLDWAVGPGAFEEFQQDIARRLPRDPSRGATRWTPARQR